MGLPRLLREFHAPGCFTLEEAEGFMGAERAREHVRYLRAQGYIETVRRGLYAFVPEHMADPTARIESSSEQVVRGTGLPDRPPRAPVVIAHIDVSAVPAFLVRDVACRRY